MATVCIGVLIELFLVLLAFVANLECIYGAKILMASTQFRSHIIMQSFVGEELLLQGHEVYFAVGSRYPQAELESLEQRGFQIIKYHIPPDVLFAVSDEMEKFLAENAFQPVYDVEKEFQTVSMVANRDCEHMLLDSKFLEQVRALKFDIALVEPFILNPCVMLLPYNLDIRFVSLTTFYLPWDLHLPALPSFYRFPGPYVAGSEPTLLNSLVSTIIYFGSHWRVKRELWNDTFLHHYSSHQITWSDVLLKSELFIMDNDHHLASHLPLFPNIIRLSGITVRPSKPLPDNLEQLVQSSDGVILVTFGSSVTYFPDEIIIKFIKTFTRLNQTVIAKLTIPDGVEVPANVHISRWLPQNDILGHPKTRLFITHCGSNGQHEAVYHGVPMLGFPLFGEQPTNCDRVYDKGFGLQMNIRHFTSDELYDNIQELFKNKTYCDNIQHLSAIMRDEPLLGSAKAAFWIEHVMKYGSSHLRSPAADMPFYRFLMLDVLLVLAVVGLVAVVSSCMCIAFIYKKLC